MWRNGIQVLKSCYSIKLLFLRSFSVQNYPVQLWKQEVIPRLLSHSTETSFSPHTPYVLILLLAFFFALNLKHVTPFEDSEM